MSAVTFDTLKLARKLQQSGFSQEQAAGAAEAMAEAMSEQVATRSDLRELASELKLWTAGLAGVVIAALSALKVFGH